MKDNRKKHISFRYYTTSRVETPVNTIISRGNKKLDIDIKILKCNGNSMQIAIEGIQTID